MSKPRPPNMFQHPQESAQAPMRDKLLFIETLVADPHLTPRELKVGIALVCNYSTTTGDSCTALEYLAAALGMGKRHVLDAVNRLEAKGYYSIERGTRGRPNKGTKNSISRYRPNPEKVPSGAPFGTAAQMYQLRRYEEKRFPYAPRKVPLRELNTDYVIRHSRMNTARTTCEHHVHRTMMR